MDMRAVDNYDSNTDDSNTDDSNTDDSNTDDSDTDDSDARAETPQKLGSHDMADTTLTYSNVTCAVRNH
jgi:hypothetical protein